MSELTSDVDNFLQFALADGLAGLSPNSERNREASPESLLNPTSTGDLPFSFPGAQCAMFYRKDTQKNALEKIDPEDNHFPTLHEPLIYMH